MTFAHLYEYVTQSSPNSYNYVYHKQLQQKPTLRGLFTSKIHAVLLFYVLNVHL